MRTLRILLIGIIFTLGCDRSPDRPMVTVTLRMPGGGGGFQAPGLPSPFSCFVVGIHSVSDTDGSHCFISSFGEVDATAAFGPFQNSQTVQVAMPSGPTEFALIGSSNSLFCGSSSISFSSGNNTVLALEQLVNLQPGANTVNFNIPQSLSFPLGGTVSACQGVQNVN